MQLHNARSKSAASLKILWQLHCHCPPSTDTNTAFVALQPGQLNFVILYQLNEAKPCNIQIYLIRFLFLWKQILTQVVWLKNASEDVFFKRTACVNGQNEVAAPLT